MKSSFVVVTYLFILVGEGLPHPSGLVVDQLIPSTLSVYKPCSVGGREKVDATEKFFVQNKEEIELETDETAKYLMICRH